MDIERLQSDIKYNSNVSDAQYWGYFSLCGMLMRMRELYYHEHSLPPWEKTDKKVVSAWIGKREEYWAELEERDFRVLELEGQTYSPFDVDEINEVLKTKGYVYGAGYGLFKKPVFFLGELGDFSITKNNVVYFLKNELCHDMMPSIAMRQGQKIYLRYEPLRSYIFHMFQEIKKSDNNDVMHRAFKEYEITSGDDLDSIFFSRFDEILEETARILIWHEIGEIEEADETGAWLDLLHEVDDKTTELYLRGIKDVIADTGHAGVLKHIIDRKERGLLYFYAAFSDSIRRNIFPEFRQTLQKFMETENWMDIEAIRIRGYENSKRKRDEMLQKRRESSLDVLQKHVREMLNARSSG